MYFLEIMIMLEMFDLDKDNLDVECRSTLRTWNISYDDWSCSKNSLKMWIEQGTIGYHVSWLHIFTNIIVHFVDYWLLFKVHFTWVRLFMTQSRLSMHHDSARACNLGGDPSNPFLRHHATTWEVDRGVNHWKKQWQGSLKNMSVYLLSQTGRGPF